MVAPQAFKVLTEFKFDVGSALVSSGHLQNAVGKVSEKADEALFSMQRLSQGLVLDLGFGGGSLLGFLGQAIKSSEEFKKSQLDFTNLISSNAHVLSGDIDTFNDKMNVSKNILKEIAKDAQKFGLNEKSLANQTKQTAALLVPKGLAGDNFGEARNLSRNLLKSAPSLGVDPGLVQGQLSRTIEGRASMGDTLFIRLANETKAFGEVLKGAENKAKKFNALPLKERFDILQRGMKQFANDTDVLSQRASTFSQLFQTLRNIFSGFDGILLPIGDAISGPLKDTIKEFIGIVDTDFRKIFKSMATIFVDLKLTTEGAIIGLMQLKDAIHDVELASKGAGLVGLGLIVLHFVKLGAVAKFIGPALGFLARGLGAIIPMIMKFAGPVIGFLVGAVVKVIPVFLALFGIFQLFSRANAIAKVADAKALPGIMARITESIQPLMRAFNIMAEPFINMFNAVAEFISPLFSFAFLWDKLASGISFVSDILISFMAGLNGAAFALAGVFLNLKSGNILGAFDDLSSDFDKGTQSFLDEVFKPGTDAEKDALGTVQSNVNIGSVNINQDFKEKMEPDRVAFSVKSQLMKLSQNPTQAVGGGFSLTGNAK